MSTPLRAARDAAGLSRERVTRLLEPPVSVQTLTRWEAGVRPAPRWRLEELARIYRVELETLCATPESAS